MTTENSPTTITAALLKRLKPFEDVWAEWIDDETDGNEGPFLDWLQATQNDEQMRVAWFMLMGEIVSIPPACQPAAVDAGLGSPLDALRWISANVTDEPARELLSRLVTDYAVLSGNLRELFANELATGGKPVDAIAELVKLERDGLKRQLAAAGERLNRIERIAYFPGTDVNIQPSIYAIRDVFEREATPLSAPDVSALVEAVQVLTTTAATNPNHPLANFHKEHLIKYGPIIERACERIADYVAAALAEPGGEGA